MIHIGQITPEEAYPILNHPEVMPYFTEDPFEPPYTPCRNSNVAYLGAFVDYKIMGCFVAEGRSWHYIEGHIALLPEARGQLGLELGKAAIKWVWNNSDTRLIMCPIAACNKRASAYARSVGMEYMHKIPKIWLKNGKFWDINVYKTERG